MGVGRKPKPLEMKLLAGNPGKRPLKKNRLVVPCGKLVMPDYFSQEEAAIWNKYMEIIPKRMITVLDQDVFITYIEQVAIKNQAMRELKAMAEDHRKPDGSTAFMAVETERGWVKNPLITVIDTCAKNIRYYASELGFTAASRERLGSAGGEEEINPFAQFKKPAANQTTA
jgi:P27 family predicted phage terminase small subunit